MLLAAGAGNLEYVSEPLHAELLAFQQAVHAAIQMGCQKVMFEIDCLVLMQTLLSDEYDLSTLGTLFKEVKFLLHVGLSDVSIIHCKRECNVAAHTLAAQGVCMEAGCSENWLGQFPKFVSDAVAGDMSSVLIY